MKARTPAEALSKSVDVATGIVGTLGRALGSSLRLPGLGVDVRRASKAPPGSSPGIESLLDDTAPPAEGSIGIHCVQYSEAKLESFEVTDLQGFLAEPRPDWVKVRWINVDGLHPHIVNLFRATFGFHTLAAEDVLRTPQRPKLEDYDTYLFIVMHMLSLDELKVSDEQVSLFFYSDTLITFQEREGDIWDPVRERLKNPESRLRNQDVSYLLYTLLDALVDHCFPLLEKYGDQLESLEDQILTNPAHESQRRIHAVKRELSLLRRVLWPTREVINTLQREETSEVSPYTRTYMRDVYDHTIQVMDVLETYREMAGGLNDLYMSVVSNRMNEVMKVLTLMASFFIPITFLAGVYGMNFEHIPELAWPYSYAVFWGVCLLTVGGLASYFFRKGWFDR